MKRGEVLGSLFQVQSGHCVVTKKGSRVGVVTANQMFGEMSLVLSRFRCCCVRPIFLRKKFHGHIGICHRSFR